MQWNKRKLRTPSPGKDFNYLLNDTEKGPLSIEELKQEIRELKAKNRKLADYRIKAETHNAELHEIFSRERSSLEKKYFQLKEELVQLSENYNVLKAAKVAQDKQLRAKVRSLKQALSSRESTITELLVKQSKTSSLETSSDLDSTMSLGEIRNTIVAIEKDQAELSQMIGAVDNSITEEEYRYIQRIMRRNQEKLLEARSLQERLTQDNTFPN